MNYVVCIVCVYVYIIIYGYRSILSYMATEVYYMATEVYYHIWLQKYIIIYGYRSILSYMATEVYYNIYGYRTYAK